MKKPNHPLFPFILFLITFPFFSWAGKANASTDTLDHPTETPTLTDESTTQAPPNTLINHQLYTFDAMWTNSSDPLNDPEGLTIGPSGDLVIADSGNNRIAIWSSDGAPLKDMGSFGPSANWRNPPQFNHPTAVYVDPTGKFYVSDTLNNRIVVLDQNGLVLSTWGTQGSGPGQFNLPRSIGTDHYGNFWVLDSGNSRVEIFSALGQYNSTWGSFGTGDYELNNPLGMTLNDIDQAIIADTGNFRFEVFNTGGAGVTQEGWFGDGPYQFKEPCGVVVTKEGWVAIVDGQNDGINFYNSRNGEFEFIGMWRARNDIISPNYHPHFRGIACDSSDRLYLTDIATNTIVRLKPVNEKTVLFSPTFTPTPVAANPYSGNGYPIR